MRDTRALSGGEVASDGIENERKVKNERRALTLYSRVDRPPFIPSHYSIAERCRKRSARFGYSSSWMHSRFPYSGVVSHGARQCGVFSGLLPGRTDESCARDLNRENS